jgi:glutaredoxin
MRVVLYSREGCHLCDAARDVILAERERTQFEFEEIDIGGNDTLELEYGIRIPVVEVDRTERFEIEVDPSAFATLVGGR